MVDTKKFFRFKSASLRVLHIVYQRWGWTAGWTWCTISVRYDYNSVDSFSNTIPAGRVIVPGKAKGRFASIGRRATDGDLKFESIIAVFYPSLLHSIGNGSTLKPQFVNRRRIYGLRARSTPLLLFVRSCVCIIISSFRLRSRESRDTCF